MSGTYSMTPQQQAAIDARGKIIVSASAGSGKTQIMVSRYVALLLEGADVGQMLAVTFTNKAAAQMRDRLRGAILDRLAAEPEGSLRAHLTRQLSRLSLADVCTIHSFCGRLIRTYFYLVGVDPRFTVAGGEDAALLTLSARAADLTFETAYADGSAERLLGVYFRKKKDKKLRETVVSLYEKARGNADADLILQEVAEGSRDDFDAAAKALLLDFKRRARRTVDVLEEVRRDVSSDSGLDKSKKLLDAAETFVRTVLGAEDLFALTPLGAFDFPRSQQRTAKLTAWQTGVIDRLRAVAASLKEIAEELKPIGDRGREYDRFLSAREQGADLARLAISYGENFARLKREANVLDYADLEHLALRILQSEEAREAIRGKYSYVFVDEYQDVNPLQERLISELGADDVFLVGDKKQAIYGFRGSRSVYFEQKQQEFGDKSLLLSSNFRSAEAILETVNTVFGHTMPAYDPMVSGGLYANYRGEVQFHPLAEDEALGGERGVYSVKEANARSGRDPTAEKVLEIVEREAGRQEGMGRSWYDISSRDDPEDSRERPVMYGDIAVLVRKNTKAAGPIVRALSERGIPVTASAEVNICDFFEVRLIIDWLSFLDNPEQDIPMAAAMLSAIGKFTEGELAAIRLAHPKGSFREACGAYGAEDTIAEKLRAFRKTAERNRALMFVRTPAEMITTLLAEGLEAQIAARRDGKSCLSRVRRLIAESAAAVTVNEFLSRLKSADYEVEFNEAGGEDAVHVMTMHASKGLEFPVVILTELDEKFRKPDHDELMWTDRYLVAPRYFDPARRVYCDTILRRAAALDEWQRSLEGERNLLYVGMTRACCRLHMIFSEGYPVEDDECAALSDPQKLSDFLPRGSLLALIAPPADQDAQTPPSSEAYFYLPNAAIVEEIRRAARPYAFEAGSLVPVKSSATDLLRRNDVPMYETDGSEIDDTMSELIREVADMGVGFNVDTGLAYHAFLEHVRFGSDVREELARMEREQFLTPEQLALLNAEHLGRILSLGALRRAEGKRLYREQRFLVSLPAREVPSLGIDSDDEIVFQGAIDLLVEEGDGKYTVVDYKFSSHDDETIRRHYLPQLHLYRKTVAKILHAREEDVGLLILNIALCREIALS